MKKKTVAQKMLELMRLYHERIEASIRTEEPRLAVYWASMAHSLFALSKLIQPDKQMSLEIYGEMTTLEVKAEDVLRILGPLRDNNLSGLGIDPSDPVLVTYDRFRQELDALGLI